MAKARFKPEDLQEAVEEFISKAEVQVLPGAGHNGDILIIRGEENGSSEAASE